MTTDMVGKDTIKKIILVAPNAELCKNWEIYIQNIPNIEIVQGYFQNLPEFDCMVSAANSFGLMDGGVDLSIIDFFGQKLMGQVQHCIIQEYLGEQPVGTSLIVETQHPKHPFIAHTPTMRLPMPISHTDNVYVAMWAMLLAVRKHNRHHSTPIEVVACPRLGTATGKMSFEEAAKQMAFAYSNFLNPPSKIDWEIVTKRLKPMAPYDFTRK